MNPREARDRYRSSKTLTYDRWHEGESYDLDAFAAMSVEDRDAEAAAIRALEDPDWRDLEVLRIEGSKQSIAHLRDLLTHPSIDTRAHALREIILAGKAPGSVPDVHLAHILNAIGDDRDGMTQALILAHHYGGPMSKLALLRGARDRPGVALHYAAALLDLANLSDDMAAFDPKFRPTLLQMRPEVPDADRDAAFRLICSHLGIDPDSIPEANTGDDRAWAEKIWPMTS